MSNLWFLVIPVVIIQSGKISRAKLADFVSDVTVIASTSKLFLHFPYLVHDPALIFFPDFNA